MKRSLLPIALAAATITASASGPVFWQVSTQAEFLRGEVDGLSVDDEGRLRLGPATDTVLETPEPALWSLARASDGALWIGSGTDGRLYRLGADGAGTVVLDADELDVHALAADRAGGVYAGTSPGGRVYRVTAGGGATVVFDPDETYIWALALDGDGFYFTDPGAFEPSNAEGRVHYSGPDFQPWPVASGLSFPNGVVLAPNGGTLYVAETLTNRIIAVQLLTRGLPGRQSELVDLSGEVDPASDGFLDGITVDQDGNIYAVIHGGGQIYVVNPGGEVLRRYRAGMVAPANLAFSPTEPGRLYVVGSRDAERTEGAITVLDLPGREGVHR